MAPTPIDPWTVPAGGMVTLRRREELARYYSLGFRAVRISPTGVVMRRAASGAPVFAEDVTLPAPARTALARKPDALGIAALALGTFALLAWLAR